MRILHITDNSRSSYRLTYEVLARRGFDLETLPLQELRNTTATWRGKIDRYLPDRRIAKLISDKVSAFRPDIIHIGTGRTAALATLRALPAGGSPPIIIERGAINGINPFSPLDWRIFFSARINAVIMPSRAMLNNWTGKPSLSRLIPPGRCEVVHHPIPPAPAYSAEQRLALRREFGFADNEFIIGTACAIRPIKNLDFLASAIADMGDRYTMAVMGWPDRPERMARLKNIGGKSLRLLGPVADARTKMAAFDIYATPTRNPGESFGIAAAEAMAAGLPGLTMQVGGTAEIIEHGISGFALPPIASHWSTVIKELAGNPDLVRRMGIAARHRIESAFSPGVIADQFENLYRRRARKAG